MRARKAAEEKVGFYFHFIAYALVNIGLWMLWYFTSPDSFPWPIFVTFFWGIGLVAHAIDAYGGGRYTESLAEREYQKLRRKQGP